MKLVQVIVLLSVLSLVSLMAVAYGSDEPAPTAVPAATTALAAPAATESPEPTAAPPSDGEVFELKYSSPLSPPPFLTSEVQNQ